MQATPAFYAAVKGRLPEMLEKELAEHARWIAEQQSRQGTKRRLLGRWRERRVELERESQRRREELQAQDEARRRQTQEQRHQFRTEQRQQIQEWRLAKAEEEERAAVLLREAEQEQRRQELDQLRQQQSLLREATDAYRSRKEAERLDAERSEALRQASAARRALSQEDRSRIAQRNMDLLKKKIQAQTTAPARPPPAHPPRSLEHVKSRLHATTESFVQKVVHHSDGAAASQESKPTPVAKSATSLRANSSGPALGHKGRRPPTLSSVGATEAPPSGLPPQPRMAFAPVGRA
mmetsp:Transcript_34413/g.73277  ORF Transcript_34413/g.73277 Transcript_34413/m.73277 type:complete len:294 (+) Transcript_34413:2-883(+)